MMKRLCSTHGVKSAVWSRAILFATSAGVSGGDDLLCFPHRAIPPPPEFGACHYEVVVIVAFTGQQRGAQRRQERLLFGAARVPPLPEDEC